MYCLGVLYREVFMQEDLKPQIFIKVLSNVRM